MDVQGSQFHLLHGRTDWGGCTDAALGVVLDLLWPADPDRPVERTPDGLTSWEYDEGLGALRLRRDTPLFRHVGGSEPLEIESRRGADRDVGGAWYWIDLDRRGIARRGAGALQPEAWWSVDDLAKTCTHHAHDTGRTDAMPGDFTGTCTCSPVDMALAGLCVTTHDYLLAGYASSVETGLLAFDLRAGGTPLRLLWPEGDLDAWDLAATPDGGALLLDRTHGNYWRLDEHLRVRGTIPMRPSAFESVDPAAERAVSTGAARPTPVPLVDSTATPVHPVSVAPGPGGTVLLLESDTSRGYSRLFCYDGLALRWETSLEDAVQVVDPNDPDATSLSFSVLGHDVVCLEGAGPLARDGERAVLYVADAGGDQVIAFDLDPVTGDLDARDDFLPLRRWAGRALVDTATKAGADDEQAVWFDFDQPSTRWVSLQVFAESTFATAASLRTPLDLDPSCPGPFDSRLPGCVWHRVLLDAYLPAGTTLAVRVRAADDPDLLQVVDWVGQPTPYLRSGGSELPYDDPWAAQRGDVRDPLPLPAGMGTYELLVQQAAGRYLQLELMVTGPGRATPLVRSLRAWYPRFSYVEQYLPTVYAETDGPDRFLERFLANMEGLYTALEERIEHTHVLLDARTAPAVDLPWLAAWFGLALAPEWDEARRRFLIRHVDRFYRLRGTPAGLLATLRVYLVDALDESVFGGCDGPGGIRIVERFLTRDTRGAEYGAPPAIADPDPLSRARTAAHRFDVLVPVELGEERIAMVERIVEQARPAHTAFQLRRYYELFVVGQARLGIDSELGTAPTFTPMYAGTALATGYLGYPFPFDLTDRVVADRDRLGRLPAL